METEIRSQEDIISLSLNLSLKEKALFTLSESTRHPSGPLLCPPVPEEQTGREGAGMGGWQVLCADVQREDPGRAHPRMLWQLRACAGLGSLKLLP